MKLVISVFLLFLFSFAPASADKVHPCQEDAQKQALKLLRFHYDDTKQGEIDEAETKILKPFKNPAAHMSSKSRFDVIEVIGWVYKAGYRMRMIYHTDHSEGCGLVGQEILDWLPNER